MHLNKDIYKDDLGSYSLSFSLLKDTAEIFQIALINKSLKDKNFYSVQIISLSGGPKPILIDGSLSTSVEDAYKLAVDLVWNNFGISLRQIPNFSPPREKEKVFSDETIT